MKTISLLLSLCLLLQQLDAQIIYLPVSKELVNQVADKHRSKRPDDPFECRAAVLNNDTTFFYSVPLKYVENVKGQNYQEQAT